MGVSAVFQPPPVAVSSLLNHRSPSLPIRSIIGWHRRENYRILGVVFVNNENTPSTYTSTSASISSPSPSQQEQTEEQQGDVPDAEDLQYVNQIKTVLELLKKNRDMLFNEVKLTIMIEDPRDVERRRLLGIDDENAPSRDDLAAALVQVNEGQVPKDRVLLRMLAEEMLQWPNLEVEIGKEKKPGKSLYARFTDTGIDPKEAAKRLNIDWDSAAEIGDAETDEVEVPSAVGYGALYLVTAFPVIIGISVVLILFYNSLQ
ncbi:hypothetical protein ACP275_13G204700 [Erythranthe tilingii]